ncbi:MAG: DUF2283 domain-containing protein [Firmicutes bacterium]|nr:DUF2283 domain-containing protein [Bacillota bacterium]
MELHYCPETDSLYVDLADRTAVDSIEVAPGLVVDLDAEGRLVGLDVDHASQTLDLRRIVATVDHRPVADVPLLASSARP